MTAGRSQADSLPQVWVLLTHLWWLEGAFLQLLLQLRQRGVGDQLLEERKNIYNPSGSRKHEKHDQMYLERLSGSHQLCVQQPGHRQIGQ